MARLFGHADNPDRPVLGVRKTTDSLGAHPRVRTFHDRGGGQLRRLNWVSEAQKRNGRSGYLEGISTFEAPQGVSLPVGWWFP